ncbi:PH domain-containing protein, partial [Streptomyces sp. 7G]|uniref:PH domain-containing protein n=1 Tax=Streptomyces sp. 7G TaxID=2877241 RepID=UPI001CD3C29D
RRPPPAPGAGGGGGGGAAPPPFAGARPPPRAGPGGATATAVLFPLWWFRTHRWEVTEDAVYVLTGFFWQEWRIAPMSRIQTVDTVRGPLEQLFRLATVTVTTASAKGAVRIEGLDHEVAADLAERLTRITRDTPGDAT